MKTRPVRTELFQADVRADSTKLRVTFRHITKAPKILRFVNIVHFLCFVRISEQTVIISLYNIN